ncbi:phage baseplate assembly protein domain-containing protein [Chelatococcus reniformis]|uniref:Bacteriophage Mu Gp45 N-terminal domain-containing protein n=1 Tax=Chelatococcus reniformis TaxID=1494448 RepID=A0A916UVC3_9HYPH|nr:phage baseplate assembly protein [Chelatococcus reniformis]GGC90267.1 hypothetical protein GCM10010994_55130 [Chelatococcus reniformis]
MRTDFDDLAGRSYSGVFRGTLVKASDNTKMQELEIRGRFGERITNVEHWHPYGSYSVPLAPKDGKEAEVLVANLGGSADHPVVLGVADRRHRPTGLQPGETGLHDDQGQRVHIGRDGIVISAPDTKSITVQIGGVSFKVSKDGVDITGGYVKHNGRMIDATHRHDGVQPGGGNTGEPLA